MEISVHKILVFIGMIRDGCKRIRTREGARAYLSLSGRIIKGGKKQ